MQPASRVPGTKKHQQPCECAGTGLGNSHSICRLGYWNPRSGQFFFGSNRALDGVNLAVKTGTVSGVLGPNDAGKSTVLSMFARLLRPDSGKVKNIGS